MALEVAVLAAVVLGCGVPFAVNCVGNAQGPVSAHGVTLIVGKATGAVGLISKSLAAAVGSHPLSKIE